VRGWRYISTRHPFWRTAGLLTLAVSAGLTVVYVARGPKPLKATSDPALMGASGAQGRFGTITEPMGKGLFVLSYDTITGQEEDLQLQKVHGKLDEPDTTWAMDAPSARKAEGVWTLNGPMSIDALAPDGKTPIGKGTISSSGPALGWDKGVWHGLSPLVWDDYQGSGRGRWDLPAGWQRGLDQKFVVDHGPVHWEAAQPGTVKSMEAERMWAGMGFREGHLEAVQAALAGGSVRAKVVDVEPEWIRWSGPLSFARDDGWHGTAAGGRAPRPPEGGAFEKMEFTDFDAQRAMPGGGTEEVRSEGARWTPAGLRLEGNVRLEQPLEGQRLLLQAPRVLQRTAPAKPGDDLPPNLPVGESWAEGQAVLTWGSRSLTSPHIEGQHKIRQWRIQAPVLGRSEMGTFSAGEGRGNPLRWEFDGPILAHFGQGASAQGDSLVWENERYTFSGRPVTLTQFRERLTGPRLVRQGEEVDFPVGIAGALAAQDGDINLQADRGHVTRTLVVLDGRVECRGQGWNLQADKISVTLTTGNMVKRVDASGAVFLRGRMGEGRGDALVLDPVQKTANWIGRVRALTEVAP
jgi:hypothetical protein